MIYLLLGEASAEKEKRILDIREKLFPTPDACKFDYEVLYAEKLSPQILKERLMALPTLAPHRLLVVHGCEDLSAQNRDLIIDFLSLNAKHLNLILTADKLSPKDAFYLALKPLAKVFDSGQKAEIRVFDMTNCLDRRQIADALQVLADLLESGQHPLQIMGGLIWFWRQKRNRLSAAKFEEGLQLLQEADLNIKRSRVAPDYAMEILVVKLGKILA